MPTSIITTEDLNKFKEELLKEIREIIQQHGKGISSKKWLKSTEVMKLLQISPGTLQNLRINGTLPFTKVGGIIYYDASDIQDVLDSNKIQNRLS
ncbi:DNA-binding protein [Gramella sp. BOM4]|uniref:Helix-turn-helix domain-containing protein n=1 Tax=Christiangramia oceanisediminis TaxID=2920386 RepID=A0A9X2RDG3_9FLAO|nr:helix-turn-helix domain-containing protein [Gramella oceanisediminis]MCP9201310.1 helix-turn-helix domain-containing protein [Gramella oceanisediminis]MUP46538.1 DNA-binding protein [Christiangramia bathymodioli]